MEVLFTNNNWRNNNEIENAVANGEQTVYVYHSPSFASAIRHLCKNPYDKTIIFLEDFFHAATLDFLKDIKKRKLPANIVLLATSTISEHQLHDYNELGVDCIIDKRKFKKRLQQTLRIIIRSTTGLES